MINKNILILLFSLIISFHLLQTMIDWNWLWVVGEFGISYGFYRWWKSDDKFLAVFEVIDPFVDLIGMDSIDR